MAMKLVPPLFPAPTPGHDPGWWLLNAAAGWRAMSWSRDDDPRQRTPLPPGAGLALAAIGNERSLTESTGSFGGLATPSNVAVTPDGSVYLLDAEAARLKRFDPCECRFDVVPCLAGSGPGARQVRRPGGIGIHGDTLYLCDTGNRQLKVFALPYLALRAIWVPPASFAGAAAWEPFDVAFDRRGLVFVSDRANGAVHRFAPSGRWLDPPLTELPGATHLAIARDDRLFVVVTNDQGAPAVVVAAPGEPATVATESPAELAAAFPPLPFVSGPPGYLDLGALCHTLAPATGHGCRRPTGPCRPSEREMLRFAQHDGGAQHETAGGVFNLGGNRVPPPPPSLPAYEREGYYFSEALDSALYRCQWHRLVLTGHAPPGGRVRVWTYTADAPHADAFIRDLPDEDWGTDQVATRLDPEWDCLIRGDGGRYLWLKVQLRGDGTATPRLESIRVEFPRLPLTRYLPAVFAADPTGADFTDRFLALFDTTLRGFEATLDTQARFFDPRATPAAPVGTAGIDFLSWLASWLGVALDRYQSEARRRRLLAQAARQFHLRGTPEGLRRQLLGFLGWDGSPANGSGPIAACACRTAGPATRPTHTCRPAPLNCAPPAPAVAWEPPPLILEHFRLRRWLFAGAGRLGDQAVLWGRSIVGRSQLDENAQADATRLITSQDPQRDPFYHFAHKFTVFVPAWVERSPSLRRGLETLLRTEAPAHTLAAARYVEPRFRIGVQATIGFDAVVGRYPRGVALEATALGPASVLTDSAGRLDDPPPTVGAGPGTRIGGLRL